MADDGLEDRLRRLSGVLDCSVLDDGVALLVDPEIDARLVRARAQSLFVEACDPRPLLLIGGATPEPARPAPWLATVLGKADTTLPAAAIFVVVVLSLLSVVPVATRQSHAPTELVAPFTDDVTHASATSGLTPELARPRASIQRRATGSSSSAAAVEVAVPVEPAAEEDVQGQVEERSPEADLRTGDAVVAPLPLPVTVAVTVPVPVAPRGPGNSGAHRRFPKGALPLSRSRHHHFGMPR